jgi:integrase
LEQLRRQGTNPKVDKADKRAVIGRSGLLFEDLAEQFIRDKYIDAGKKEIYIKNELNKIDNEMLPSFKGRPIASIKRADCIAIKDAIEKRGSYEQAKRVMALMQRMFAYAINREHMPGPNPAQLIEREASAHVPKSHPSLTQWADVPPFLKALNENVPNAEPVTILAIKVLLLTGLRVEAVIPARWNEINIAERTWRVPKERMKIGKYLGGDHLVPISTALIDVIEDLEAINGEHEHLFWSFRGKKDPHMSKSTPNQHLVKMGYQGRMTAHGVRHMLQTHGQEILKVSYEVISVQLGHIHKDPIRRAYDKSQWWSERVELMQRWGELLLDAGL